MRSLHAFCLILGFSTGTLQAFASQTPSVNVVFEQLKNRTSEVSPDIRSAQAAYDQKRAQTYTAFARWAPRLDLHLSRSRSIDYSIITSGALGQTGPTSLFNPQEVNLSRWQLDLDFSIYRRAVHVYALQSLAEKNHAEQQLQLRKSELDWRLHLLLGDYLLKLYKIASLKNSITIAKSNLKEARLRFELGQRTKVDVLRSEANLVSLESKALTYEQERVASASALLEYTGLDRQELKSTGLEDLMGSEDAVSMHIDTFTQIEELEKKSESYLSEEKISQTIASSSPVYKTYLAEQEASDARAQALMEREWPELSITGNLNKQGPKWNDAISTGSVSHSIALVLTVPLFSGGTTISSYREKKYAEQSSAIKTERDIIRLRDEAQDDLTQIRALQKALQSQVLNKSQNEELVRLSQKSYQLGKATLVELLGSENDLFESKLALAQTKLNLSVLLRKFSWKLGVSLE